LAGAPPPWELAGARIRAAVAAAHDVPLRALYFVERGRLVRTSSGKLERATTRRALHDGAIAVLAQWDAGRGWIAP
jgi:hypothetical protein